MKDFSGYKIRSSSSSIFPYNGKIIEKTIDKVFPNIDNSTLYIVKVEGLSFYLELQEDEMVL